jgi:hypothetical protein
MHTINNNNNNNYYYYYYSLLFENRVLRRIFGPKRDEVTGEWRKLHNEELRDLYSSQVQGDYKRND